MVYDRVLRLAALAFAAGSLAAAAGIWDPKAVVAVLPPLCPLRLLTGVPCPGCGMGRAVAALMAWDARGATAHHPFSVPFVAAVVLWAALPDTVRARAARLPLVSAVLPALSVLVLLAWWVAVRVA